MATKWGIASAGLVSHDFVNAIRFKPNDHKVVAIAARSLEKAKELAKSCDIEQAYGSYEEIAKDPNVEIVYVGTFHPAHFKVASLMLNSGKHVLCEKPLCMNVAETQALLDLAKEKKLFLMEAVWSRCFPTYSEVKKAIESDELGEVVQVMATFGFPHMCDVSRIIQKELGGGVTFDIGIYGIQFILWIFGYEKPQKILAGGHLGKGGCDESMSLVMLFSNNRTAVVSCNSRCKLPNEGLIFGTKGNIKIPDFWCPFGFEAPSGKKSFPLKVNAKFNFHNSEGFIYEADEVRRCLKEGLLECPLMTHKETLLCAEIMQECLQQMGVDHSQL